MTIETGEYRIVLHEKSPCIDLVGKVEFAKLSNTRSGENTFRKHDIYHEGNILAYNLFQIDGITEIVINDYQLRILYSKIYSADEIIPKVLSVISLLMKGQLLHPGGSTFCQNSHPLIYFDESELMLRKSEYLKNRAVRVEAKIVGQKRSILGKLLQRLADMFD